ncbi:hypothetical protein KUCAC02_000380 [Chaenocephalus aceratus]|uniref:Uncharacterized protein n=1 Tax=Chaenocephalus aceratus TaxID=36190 RepID=A0ACB9W5C8_CHAAC|nr:hypothetical protein KUCAC02_000380 [Chaenocephalus aceratus]
MDSPTDLFEDSSPQIHAFAPSLSSTDLPAPPSAGRPSPAFRPPGFPLIHHLLQPGGAPRRIGGQLNTNLRQQEDRNLEEVRGEVEQGTDGGEEGGMEREDSLMGFKKRHSDAALAAEWSQDVLKVKRMKLESRPKGGEAEEGGRRREGGREGRRREREELKEQLDEARERLQALQEKVWRAFGEKHMAEEEEKKGRCKNREDGGEDAGLMEEEEEEEEEDITEGMYDEEDIEGGDMEKEAFSLLSVSPFDSFHKQREERQKDGEGRMEKGRGLHLEGVMEEAGLWLDCGGLVRGDWHGGVEEEGEEGGQKFAQALKVELGSAVARVIDRVLRLYTEMTDPSSPPAAISFLPPGNDGGRERGVWMGLLTQGRREEKMRGNEEKTGRQDGEREKQLQNRSSGAPPHRSEPSDLSMPLAVQSKLFSRSLHHHQLPHLPPSRKDYLNSDPFLEFSAHPSSHPSFPPLPLLGHLDPSLARHAHGGRERGMRGDGGMRGGGMDGGELYLTAGGISFCPQWGREMCFFMSVLVCVCVCVCLLNWPHVYTQEGLSPCHLKKAKLMFFYARYPSSNTLKTYFPDFNRCVTSQMIKWFSNFREFFYIQMERFARQAVREALTRDGAPRVSREGQLRVGRDTELYRILNMHYNKSNVYQVPERFIEISEVALREFYSAIWTGRDSDPCWKKGIYKIICKMDSPVPDAFRLPGCPIG